MPSSPARIAANRANARKSTGPRTAEGKARSRANAVKHGLTGEGVAIPAEDAPAVAARFEALRDELAPQTALGGILVHRVALMSVRLDRSARREAAALAGRVEGAGADFDEARMAEVQRLIERLGDDPASAVRKLRRMPEGVDRMIKGWCSLREDLNLDGPGVWYNLQANLAERLTGRNPDAVGESRIGALWRATASDASYLRPGEAEAFGEDRRACAEWALARLFEIVDGQLAELRGHRATLDPGAVARERARSADMALFDPSKEAVLARKYEAATERAMYKALNEFREVERAASEAEAMGSFSPDPEAEVKPPPPRRLAPRPAAPQGPESPLPVPPIAPERASATAPRRPD